MWLAYWLKIMEFVIVKTKVIKYLLNEQIGNIKLFLSLSSLKFLRHPSVKVRSVSPISAVKLPHMPQAHSTQLLDLYSFDTKVGLNLACFKQYGEAAWRLGLASSLSPLCVDLKLGITVLLEQSLSSHSYPASCPLATKGCEIIVRIWLLICLHQDHCPYFWGESNYSWRCVLFGFLYFYPSITGRFHMC